jgi:hypothetical protein
VNTVIDRLRAKKFNNDAIFATLRKIAATKDKPSMAAAYKTLVGLVQDAKEGYETGKDMADDTENANLRFLLGVLQVAQGNPELGLAVTGVDFAESFAYLGFISGEMEDLNQATNTKLIQLNSYISRLKQDVDAANAAKTHWERASGRADIPGCGM